MNISWIQIFLEKVEANNFHGTSGNSVVQKTAIRSHYKYRKVASSNTSCFEAHAVFFRLLMKGIFNPYVSTMTF